MGVPWSRQALCRIVAGSRGGNIAAWRPRWPDPGSNGRRIADDPSHVRREFGVPKADQEQRRGTLRYPNEAFISSVNWLELVLLSQMVENHQIKAFLTRKISSLRMGRVVHIKDVRSSILLSPTILPFSFQRKPSQIGC